MSREEEIRERTVERFLECEAKRAEARDTALKQGKSKDEADEIAHAEARDRWNAWANERLAERKALEESCVWAAETTLWAGLEPKNAETRAWIEDSEAIFSRLLFFLKGGEGKEEEPGEDKDKLEAASLPVKSIAVDGRAIDFRGFIFPGAASFDSAAFTKATSFRDARFGAKEKKADADFTAIKVERAFDLSGTYFSKVPNFCQADFKQAPDLDGVDFPLPSRWPWQFGNRGLIPKFRAVRRMAIQSADYDREQTAFKGELRSRRWTTDKPWHPSLLLGFLYDWAADCGRSIFRPFSLWVISVFSFALFYLRSAIVGTPVAWEKCLSGGADPWAKALYASGRNALVVTSGRDPRVDQAYQCLFGLVDGKPNIPDGVSFVESFVQVPLSAVLIFLFLLAVRNRFKIK